MLVFLPLDREELADYNARCTEVGLPALNPVEANVLKAIYELIEENEGEGATVEQVSELTDYTPGQIDMALTFLRQHGFVFDE